MKELLLILNPCAGQRRANRWLADILRLYQDDGYRTEVYVTAAQGDATRYLLENSYSYDRIVCIGGDGTLNETVAGVLGSGMNCPIGYIPAGTTNDYASSIGLSGDIMKAAKDIVTGKNVGLDIGTFNGRYFTYTATCGAFARTSYTTSQTAKNLLGHLAYILEGMRDLATLKPLHLRVETEEKILEGDFIFCSVTNSTSVGGILKLDSNRVSLNDGKFEVTLVRNPTNPLQFNSILQSLTTMDIPSEMIEFFSVDRLKISADTTIEWTLDGERAPETQEVELVNLHDAVQILLPEAQEGAFDGTQN